MLLFVCLFVCFFVAVCRPFKLLATCCCLLPLSTALVGGIYYALYYHYVVSNIALHQPLYFQFYKYRVYFFVSLRHNTLLNTHPNLQSAIRCVHSDDVARKQRVQFFGRFRDSRLTAQSTIRFVANEIKFVFCFFFVFVLTNTEISSLHFAGQLMAQLDVYELRHNNASDKRLDLVAAHLYREARPVEQQLCRGCVSLIKFDECVY